jgi:outer membrane receptor protein involved in Fe transport
MLGNNNVSPYSYQSLINSSGTETKNGNPDLKWETVSIFDVGTDMSLFGYKLDVNLDYYYKVTEDLIMSLPSTLSSGLLNTPANVGRARSQGFEIGLSYNKDWGDKAHLNVGAGFSYNRNKWLYIPGGEFISGNTICRQGHAIRANYFYVADGLLTQEDLDNYVAIVGGYPDNGVTTQQPGDIKYKDINGDGIIDTNDRTAVGDQDPHTMFYGNLTFRWRNFDFDTQFTGQGNSNGFYYGYFIQPLNATNNGAVQRWQLDYWTPDNPNASRPRPTTMGTSNEYLSTYWMFNRAFLRVKYIQVGYSFPKLAKRIKANNLRVYANVQNALTFSALKISDPETCASNNGGAVTSKYPMLRTWTFGVNLGF